MSDHKSNDVDTWDNAQHLSVEDKAGIQASIDKARVFCSGDIFDFVLHDLYLKGRFSVS